MVGAASLVLSQGRARREYSSGHLPDRRPDPRPGLESEESKEPPGKPDGSFGVALGRDRGLDGLLGEVALHGRLAREVDPALAVDFEDDDHDLVADGHDVL